MSYPKNEQYNLEISNPLLRSGLTLKVGPFSKKHAVAMMNDVMNIIREFNGDNNGASIEKNISIDQK